MGQGRKRSRKNSDYDDYLIWSILVTLLCCMPLGIVAIVYSVRAGTEAKYGDDMKAAEDAGKARMWCIICAVVGLVPILLYGLIFIVPIGMGILGGFRGGGW